MRFCNTTGGAKRPSLWAARVQSALDVSVLYPSSQVAPVPLLTIGVVVVSIDVVVDVVSVSVLDVVEGAVMRTVERMRDFVVKNSGGQVALGVAAVDGGGVGGGVALVVCVAARVAPLVQSTEPLPHERAATSV